MIIPNYAKSNFNITDTDSPQEIMNKRYLLDRYRIGNEIYSKYEEQKKQNNFDKKYNRIMKLKTLEQLKAEITAIDKLLNE